MEYAVVDKSKKKNRKKDKQQNVSSEIMNDMLAHTYLAADDT